MADYDRAITVFSPDGHLLQVQYAAEAVKRGLCTVGVKGEDCVVLAVERKVAAKLQDARSVRKIEQIDDHAALAFAGLSADGRVLISRTRVECQSFRLTSGEAPTCAYIAKYIGGLQQKFTMRGGKRPFGVACLIVGFDASDRPELYNTEPHGILTAWKAQAIGRNDKTVKEFFERKWKAGMDRDATVRLALQGLSEVVDAGNIEVCVVSMDPVTKEKRLENLTDEQVAAYLASITSSQQQQQQQQTQADETMQG